MMLTRSRRCSQRTPILRIGAARVRRGDPFATVFRNSHQAYTDIKIRFKRAEVAAVDVRWEMTGVLDAQGNSRPDRRGLLNLVMAKDSGRWRTETKICRGAGTARSG